MTDAKPFDASSATRSDGEIVIVFFDGPEREVVGMFRGTLRTTRALWKAIGSALLADIS